MHPATFHEAPSLLTEHFYQGMHIGQIDFRLQSNFFIFSFSFNKKLQTLLKRTYDKEFPRDQLFHNQNKYFVLRILTRSKDSFVLINYFVNNYAFFCIICPTKDIEVCFGCEIAALLESFLSAL